MADQDGAVVERRFINLAPDGNNMFAVFTNQLQADLGQWGRRGEMAEIEALHRLLGPLSIALELTKSDESGQAVEIVREIVANGLKVVNARHAVLDQEVARKENEKYCAECGDELLGFEPKVNVTWEDEPGLVERMHRSCAEKIGKA
jgi:hypothetical protein